MGGVSRRKKPRRERDGGSNENNRDLTRGEGGGGFLTAGMADRDPVPVTAEVRARLAELELELSEGEYRTHPPSGRPCPGPRWLLLRGGRAGERDRGGDLEFELHGGRSVLKCHKFECRECPPSVRRGCRGGGVLLVVF